MLTRRSLLRLAATLPGLAFLAPRAAKAEVVDYARYHYLVLNLVSFAADHPGSIITAVDDPVALTLGYKCQLGNGDSKTFQISVRDLRKRINYRYLFDAESTYELLKSKQGREALAKGYQIQSILRQMRHYNIKIDGTTIPLR